MSGFAGGGPIPLLVVTGFLGSGKTTLIRRLLAAPGGGPVAVVVNEFGAVGIDHHLLRRSDERTVLLSGGCLCCTLRQDLVEALRGLLDEGDRGLLPPLARIVLETSGVADPAPILQILASDPLLRRRLRLERMVVAVDAVAGAATLARHGEAVRQVAAADRVVVTKRDLAPAAGGALAVAIRRINPAAEVVGSEAGGGSAVLVGPGSGRWGGGAAEASWDGAGASAEAARDALGTFASGATDDSGPGALPARGHGAGGAITSRAFVFAAPLDWGMFGIWLTLLLHRHGERVLRVKGLLNVGEGRGPLLLEGVQHVVHAPRHLAAWPDADRRSRLVVIAAGLDLDRVEASLAAFQAAAGG